MRWDGDGVGVNCLGSNPDAEIDFDLNIQC